MTYADLRRGIEIECANTDPDFLAQIDRFVRQAESRIGMLKKLPDYQATSQITISAATTAVPAGFISPDYVTLPGYGNLEFKDQSFLKEAYQNSETGQPRYYALKDAKTLLWGPAPDQTYIGELGYFSKWPSLVDLKGRTDETFISANFETALFHAVKYYAALFMQDPQLAALEKQEMMESLGLVERFGDGRAKKQESEETNAAATPGELN